jgi:magnesium transporter
MPDSATQPAAAAPAQPAGDVSKPSILYVGPDGALRQDLSLPELSEVVRSGKGELWVDMRVGSRQCVAMLDNVFHFHPLAVEDALNPSSRVKLDEYPGFMFAIVRGVQFQRDTEDPYDLETFNINFFLGPNYLVTVHGGQSPAFADIRDRVLRGPDLLQKGAERVMHAVMDSAIDNYFPLLDEIDEYIDALEQRVFTKFDQSALYDIFTLKRTVLSLRRHLAPQREVFNVLSNRPTPLIATESQIYFRDIYDHTLRINDTIETYRDLLSSTLESYLTQVSNRLGAITKGLSVVATLSIPFVVVSGMWGMNVVEIPWAHHAHAFWDLLAIQLTLAAGLLIILRWRNLL